MGKTISEDHIVLLDILLQQLYATYQGCLHDRKMIHDIEWEEDEESSVLGEAEVLSDFIVGYVTRIIKCKQGMGGNDRASIIRDLEASSIFGSTPIAQWIVHNKAIEYPQYYTYLQSIECLRAAAIAIAK